MSVKCAPTLGIVAHAYAQKTNQERLEAAGDYSVKSKFAQFIEKLVEFLNRVEKTESPSVYRTALQTETFMGISRSLVKADIEGDGVYFNKQITLDNYMTFIERTSEDGSLYIDVSDGNGNTTVINMSLQELKKCANDVVNFYDCGGLVIPELKKREPSSDKTIIRGTFPFKEDPVKLAAPAATGVIATQAKQPGKVDVTGMDNFRHKNWYSMTSIEVKPSGAPKAKGHAPIRTTLSS